MEAGFFITFEGGEGSGKSTQIKLLEKWFERKGINTLITREPGGSVGGEEIRSLLLRGGTDRWDQLTEILLFSAARRDHLTKKIWPALNEGKVVISDRFADSTYAYQGFGYGKDQNMIQIVDQLYTMIAGTFKPNLTIVLDIDPQIGLRRSINRAGNDEQRFEEMDLQFHRNLREAYLSLALREKDRCVVIDGNQTPDKVHTDILKILEERFKC